MGNKYEFNDIPLSWDDVTLELFTKIKKLYVEGEKPSQTALLALLTNKEEQEIAQLPFSVTEAVIESMSFLNTKITQVQSNQIEIDGEVYKIKIEEELRFGEYVDAQTVLEADADNFGAILAIVCRKENEVYDDEFIAKELNKRIEMFNNQPMTKVYPLINFLNASYATSEAVILEYSNQLGQVVNNILDNLRNSTKDGHGSVHFSLWQRIKLAKLQRSLKRILQQS